MEVLHIEPTHLALPDETFVAIANNRHTRCSFNLYVSLI